MFFKSLGGWRLKLREAEQAYRDGQFGDAAQRILSEQLLEYLPGRRLAQTVAAAMASRALQQFDAEDPFAAWSDWDRADHLASESKPVARALQKLVEQTLKQAETDLARDAHDSALQRMQPLRERQLGGESRTRLEEVAKRLDSARRLARAGRFTEAKEQLSFAKSLRPDLGLIREAETRNNANQTQCRQLDQQLHEELKAEQWTAALATCEQLLELAPEHKAARSAQKRAWAEVGAASRAPSANSVVAMAGRHVLQNRSHAGSSDLAAEEDLGGVAVSTESLDQFLLWIDAVGGYLVCRNDEVVIGQAGGAGVDIPLVADLSRRHAKIRRDGEAYLLEPIQLVMLDGKAVADCQELADGDEISLGSVRLRFRRPHPLSCSARLEFVSKHRTQPTADGVLLMAESCVLGPSQQNHIVCRSFAEDVVLFQRDKKLHCRCMSPMDVDGRRCDGVSELTATSHVSNDDFSLSLEPC